MEIKWEKKVMDFHKNNRPVQTASNLQVKKKIYRNSSIEWKKYKNWLKPMQNILNKN